MRCVSPTVYWVASDSSGTGFVEVTGVVLGPDVESCSAGQLVLISQADFDFATVSPFRLDMDSAGQLSVAVLGVWAIAWAFRVLIKLVRDTDISSESD